MNAKTQARIAIGVAAGVWFVLAITTHQSASTTALRTISIAGSIVTIVILLYEHYFWRWSVVRLFTGKPFVAGTWRGELQSDYVPSGRKEPLSAIPVVLRVKQADSTIYITLFTKESQSVSELSRLAKEPDGRWRLTWQYVNSPRPSVGHRSSVHQGLCDLYLSGKDGETLTGQYFTSRKTVGELHFQEWSKNQYADAASAFAGTDFKQAHPFARRPGTKTR